MDELMRKHAAQEKRNLAQEFRQHVFRLAPSQYSSEPQMKLVGEGPLGGPLGGWEAPKLKLVRPWLRSQ
jgi:hypothetical protein